MKKTKNFCCCSGSCSKEKNYQISSGVESTLAELPVGSSGTIVKIMPQARGRKKFADVGIISGTELVMEGKAPFGGLLRVKVMESSMALHRDDAADIIMRKNGAEK